MVWCVRARVWVRSHYASTECTLVSSVRLWPEVVAVVAVVVVVGWWWCSLFFS